MARMEDSTHRKLSVELVAVLNPKNDTTKPKKYTKMKVLHPSTLLIESTDSMMIRTYNLIGPACVTLSGSKCAIKKINAQLLYGTFVYI